MRQMMTEIVHFLDARQAPFLWACGHGALGGRLASKGLPRDGFIGRGAAAPPLNRQAAEIHDL